jgi:asparagine synthase (glutamine-hydrolysing)
MCSLGATRLKIVDLASGDQPMLSEDRESVIVFNGEIYNHLEIRRELESLGHRFRTHCDTETVLQAFLEWGTDSFAGLRGMFALAIWSNAEQRLILALYRGTRRRSVFCVGIEGNSHPSRDRASVEP